MPADEYALCQEEPMQVHANSWRGQAHRMQALHTLPGNPSL